MKKILIDGPVVSLNSASLINRQLAFRLSLLGHEVRITPEKGNSACPSDGARIAGTVHSFINPTRDVDITIRNGWPPELSRPPQGRWVVIQPWEFGSLPKKWVDVFSRDVDEMWVPSRYVRDVYVASGVPPDRVYVVPDGVDPDVFNPKAVPYPLNTKKSFRFLFVGGAIARKGIDFLLNAYTSTFTREDDVCLVIKDFGPDTFYKGLSFRDQILDLMKQPGIPEIKYIDADLTETELAGLYVASDMLVNPYRGEGFGMPILEAMACDTPAMVTNGGAALDFCDDENSLLITAREKILSKKEVFGMETVDHPRIFNVDMQDFRSKLRWAANNKKQVENIGRQGGPLIRANWTWKKSAAVANRRIYCMAEDAGMIRNPDRAHGQLGYSYSTFVSTERTVRPDHPSLAHGKLQPGNENPSPGKQKGKTTFHQLDIGILEEAAGILKPQPEVDLLDSVKKFMEKFSDIGQFYVHFGGAGDALLLLSTFYDDSPEQTIVSASPSPESMRNFFEAFPRLKDVYFIPYPENFIVHIVLRKLFSGMPGFLGMGTTPRDPYYFDEWGKVVDLTATYGARMNPDWAREFHSDSDGPPTVVIHPVGGISPLDKSVRKMITPEELTEIVKAMNKEDIVPTLIGTPAEASFYDPMDLEIDIRRSYPFDEQMRLIASCSLLVGADSWAKTFSALCGKPAIVFQSLRGGTRSGYTEVADNIFLKPWPTITVVNNVSQMLAAFHQFYSCTASK